MSTLLDYRVMNGADVAKVLGDILGSVADEAELSELVSSRLARAGADFEAEVRLSARDRCDFFVGPKGCPGVAVELKVQGSRSEVYRQLNRYTEHDVVESVVLVTTSRRLASMPPAVNGKPIHVALVRGYL